MTFPYLRRRVFISHVHGRLRVRIARGNHRGTTPFTVLVIATCAMAYIEVQLVQMMLEHRLNIYLWPIALLFLICWVAMVRGVIWEKFGVDEISIQDGILLWRSKALWLRQEVNIPVNEISDVQVITPWHGFRNRVELTVKKGTYLMGEAILRDEAKQLADELKKAADLQR